MNTLLVGAGYWGKNFIRLLENKDNLFNLKYILDSQNNLPNFKSFSNIEELDNVIEDIDCAIICTPTKTHYEVSKYLLDKKIHLLVEKPLTSNLLEAEELFNIANQNDLVLLTDHTFLYNTSIMYIIEFIKNGELGELIHISFERTNLGPIRTDVSCLWDLATHDISIMNALIDEEILSLNASGFSSNSKINHDMVNASINFKSKFVSIFVSWLHPEKSRKIKIVGKDKMIIFDDLNTTEPLKIFNKKVSNVYEKYTDYNSIFNFSLGDVVSPYLDNKEPLKEALLDFESRISNSKSLNNINTQQLTLKTIKILEDLEKSIISKGLKFL